MKNKLKNYINDFAEGNFTLDVDQKKKVKAKRRPTAHRETTISERVDVWKLSKADSFFKGFYGVASGVICSAVILILLVTVSFLPEFGNPDNPVNNEVSERYILYGLEETGAVNIVTGMILDYRAFDTFGESAVLFTAATLVMFLMKEDRKKGTLSNKMKKYRKLSRDPIVKNVAKYVIPCLIVFGLYVILNGHLSPGGGFSGGAIIGASFILYSSSFGYDEIKHVITEKFVKLVIFFSFTFYALAKGYSFFTGANHLETGIPLGNAGDILSSGLILPLNICVGFIVACTMYMFYSLFTKGEI